MKSRTDILLSKQLKARGFTLRRLSRTAGVAYSTVYNIFTGRKSIKDASAETLNKLSEALGLSMDELYDALLRCDPTYTEAPIRNFTLMWRDEPVADLNIVGSDVILERYTTNPAKQLFYADRLTLFELGEIMRTRCWDENRSDIADLLHMIGLTEYDPYAIAAKTHGLMAQDPVWFRFEGEQLNYRDVRRLNIAEEYYDR